MAEAENDLKFYLGKACELTREILTESEKLVLDVKAENYWSVYSMDTFRQLAQIQSNIRSQLNELGDKLNEGSAVFDEPLGIKLWKSTLGLFRALQPVRAKFVEQLSRRRRMRIMGQELEDLDEITPEIAEENRKLFAEKHKQAAADLEEFEQAVAALPDGLAPEPEQVEGRKQEQPEAGEDETEDSPEDSGTEAAPEETLAAEPPPAAASEAGVEGTAETPPGDSPRGVEVPDPVDEPAEPEAGGGQEPAPPPADDIDNDLSPV